eukprot:CAMPEP_0175889278 /NCGR_PEP_ID=MMETSP0107_2-20121207/47172_1 /TAXON_ID=195067 ORGANISM="Goniomonas pacifica, Strain CCMP1869" /NCGR_SAMPLE_ID=MMETSP0107_2 /ASSEMBLY_ACC=CAM_ASM_000203 /LENGTH=84 /DNA_ID=CAMNT_0017209891 /DNA_START=219 /DNA_END=470 /DNA_ORIENTATION=+
MAISGCAVTNGLNFASPRARVTASTPLTLGFPPTSSNALHLVLIAWDVFARKRHRLVAATQDSATVPSVAQQQVPAADDTHHSR